jgi:hypothetical protein
VGASTKATILANKFVPGLLDRYLARTGYNSQQTDQQVALGRPDNLWQAIDGPDGRDHGPHGIFDNRAHDRSEQLWLAQHPRMLAGLAAGTAVAGTAVTSAILTGRRARRR